MGDIVAGTVICGTHLAEDLVPAFGDLLTELAHQVTDEEERRYILHLVNEYNEFMIDPYWDEGASELVDALQDGLNRCAPEGFYFGTLEGDGADFGFWHE